MKKRVFAVFCIIVMLMTALLSVTVIADENSKLKINRIIALDQEELVLAIISRKDKNSCELEVVDVIISSDDESEDQNKTENSIVGQRITVNNLDSYVYFENTDIVPRMGDNVFLSLDREGNSYYVKNGAYRITSTSKADFSFQLPESFKEKSEVNELKALWYYIVSEGKYTDIKITGEAFYVNGEIPEEYNNPDGVTFVDASGNSTKESGKIRSDFRDDKIHAHESKWKLTAVIIIVGMIIGAFIVIKLEKRSDDFDSYGNDEKE